LQSELNYGDVNAVKTPDLTEPSPDFSSLRNVLTGESPPARLPFVDLFVDQEMKEQLLGRPVAPYYSLDPDDIRQQVDDEIEFRYKFGYDYVDVLSFVYFGTSFKTSSNSSRVWITESSTMIANREDFEKHQWPDPEWIHYSNMEYAASRLPEGMRIIPRVSGIFENVSWLTGIENLSYLLIDDPQLVAEMFDIVGSILLKVTENLVQMEGAGALFMGDDLGFRTGTLMSPDHLRQYVFPWQKKICEAAHKQGIPFILHSCGNIEKVMDDLIEDVGIDARHSFEDAILPVEQAVEKYSNRIAILGGVDMDLLTRGTEEQVRARVREIIERSASSGRFAIGTGNSIASYINPNNYLAMLDEARRV
jgi:uroporphyrinogen decarboxylase